jgi:hypothetical protein
MVIGMKIDFADWQVTPKHLLSDFALPLSVDDKITIFFERVDGWQLNIADQIINGLRDENDKVITEPIADSAYAVLNIVLSFFEMLAKYEEGYANKWKSKYYFKKGVKFVFPELTQHPFHLVDHLLTLLYEGTRCMLYHCQSTDPQVFLRNDIAGAIGLTRAGRMVINPQILVPRLRRYFKGYVKRLRNFDNIQLRMNFEKRFDYDNPVVKTT